MTKLSKKQSEVIRLMREGRILNVFEGVAFFAREPNLSTATIGKLILYGLIERDDNARTFSLTDLGKELPISADHSHVNFEK